MAFDLVASDGCAAVFNARQYAALMTVATRYGWRPAGVLPPLAFVVNPAAAAVGVSVATLPARVEQVITRALRQDVPPIDSLRPVAWNHARRDPATGAAVLAFMLACKIEPADRAWRSRFDAVRRALPTAGLGITIAPGVFDWTPGAADGWPDGGSLRGYPTNCGRIIGHADGRAIAAALADAAKDAGRIAAGLGELTAAVRRSPFLLSADNVVSYDDAGQPLAAMRDDIEERRAGIAGRSWQGVDGLHTDAQPLDVADVLGCLPAFGAIMAASPVMVL